MKPGSLGHRARYASPGWGWLLAFVAAAGLGCGSPDAGAGSGEVLIFAAASLEDALSDLSEGLESATGARAVFSFSGSNAAAQQILAGAPADLIVSADPRWIDVLEEAGKVVPGSRVDLLGNRLVVIHRAAEGAGTALAELADTLDFDTFAIGEPDSVPVGRYARSALQRVESADGRDLWQRLESRLSPMPDSRSVLRLVEGWSRAIGVVYRSDVPAGDVHVIAEIPDSLVDPPIRYVGAALRGGDAADGVAEDALAFLGSDAAAAVFSSRGFVPLSSLR